MVGRVIGVGGGGSGSAWELNRVVVGCRSN